MTRRQRDQAIEAHADLILAEESSLRAYAAHFEDEMHRGKAFRRLRTGCQWFTRVGALMTGAPRGQHAFTEQGAS